MKCPVYELFGGTPLSTTWSASTPIGKLVLLLTITTITAAYIAIISYLVTI